MKHLSILLALVACVPIDDAVDDPCSDGNDSWNTAVSVPPTTTVSGTVTCDGEEDWFSHSFHPASEYNRVRIWAKAHYEPITAYGVLDPLLGAEYLVNRTDILPEDGWVEVLDAAFPSDIYSHSGFMVTGTEGAHYEVQFDVWSW